MKLKLWPSPPTALVKTSELTGAALDWAVAKAEYTDGRKIVPLFGHSVGVETHPGSDFQFKFWPSTDWSQGGPIIEREKITTRFNCKQANTWEAYIWTPTQHDLSEVDCNEHWSFGPTPLIAAMRCFVASKLGEEVEIPEELK